MNDKLRELVATMNQAATHAQRCGGNLSWKYARDWADELDAILAEPAGEAVAWQSRIMRLKDGSVMTDWRGCTKDEYESGKDGFQGESIRVEFRALYTTPPAPSADTGEAAISNQDVDAGPEGDWYCEAHPELLQGHEGCQGAGVPACARIPRFVHIVRMLRQELRERDFQYSHLAMAATASKRLVEAARRVAMGRHTYSAIGVTDGESCSLCDHNWRSEIHYRVGESIQADLAELRTALSHQQPAPSVEAAASEGDVQRLVEALQIAREYALSDAEPDDLALIDEALRPFAQQPTTGEDRHE